ncbi:MAG: Gfo/Idh/MocA family oxidoreductase [Aggregatilineales bacterium]
MTKPVRWGILSTARIGEKRVIPAIRKSSNGVVAAVASRTLERAQAFAARLQIPVAYGTYEELIAAPDIDAIYISVPNSEHAKWSIRCAEAGKPTLCEKPLASNADEAARMVAAFAERNVLFAEAFMYRFHPQHQRVKALIAMGAIGEPHVINATFSFPVTSENNIRLQKDLAGGALMDVGCYCVNVMRFLTGEEPEGAAAFARFGERSGVDEVIAGVLRFPSGIVGHFDASLRSQRTHCYEVRGSEGRLVVPEAFVNYDSDTVIRHWRGDSYQEYVIPEADHYQLMVEDFANALLNNRPPAFPPADAIANMRVIDRLIASAQHAKES